MRSWTVTTARLGLTAMAATALVALPVATATAAPPAPIFDIPAPDAGVPTIHDGDPATTERLLRREPVTASVSVSRQRFAAASAEGRHAAFAVLARSDDFADALAGSSLLGDAPLLLTSGKQLDGRVARELDRLLPDGATVYLLGGERALGRAVADAVSARGHEVVRLAGASRVETSVAVAKEAKRLYGRKELLVARAFGTDRDPSAAWADSVAAGGLAATLGVPLVVTPTAGVHPAVARFVAASDPTRTVVLGGTAALSRAVESALPNAVRVAGADRTATAVAIAARAWGAPTSGARHHLVVNGGQADGWALGLVAAGLSADARSPVVLVTEQVSAPVRSLVRTCGEPEVDLAVMGDGSRVSPSVRERLDTLDGDACGADGAIRTPQRLEGFEGCEDVLAYYRELALERVGPWGLDGGFAIMPVEEGAPAADGDSSAGGGGGGDTRDVSGTNVQEAGVDEPDVVKTDGDRALAIAQGELQVIDLRGSRPAVAATVDLPDGDHELLLDGTRALVLSRTYAQWGGEPEPMPEPLRADTRTASSSMMAPSGTTLTLLDVAVPSNPVTIAESEVEGEYRSARLIDGTVRVVLQTAPGPFAWTYPEDDSANAMERAAEANRQIVRDATIEDWLATFTTTGAAGTTTADGLLAPCASIAAPPRPSDLGTVTVATFEMDGDLTPTSGAGIAASSDTVYASTDRLVVATQRWVGWTPDAGDTGTTELHTFDISDPDATGYVASGAVDGFLVNQFALSQHEGHLRVAATEGAPWGTGPSSSSTLSVLAEDGSSLRVVGRVGGLGEGERIFAVRFMGDLAAVVTFRQVDPLYLLDLTDPRAPRVTGELKIPGFSSYLHPVGEDLLIGVGQDADEEGMTHGTQVATYDISDLAAPRQVAKTVFPDSYSEAEYDHRAFLHWPKAGLAVVPLDEWRDDGDVGFHGAVGLDVGVTGSLGERGRISHPSGTEWPATVRRSFVVDDLLYTLSDVGLRADRLSDLRQVSWTPFR